MPVAVTAHFYVYSRTAQRGTRGPGDPASRIAEIKAVQALKPFNRVYAETLTNGPFRKVTYTLSADRKQVERVVANFGRDYARDDRLETLVELIETRLGKSNKNANEKEVTYSWRLPEYGIQLRKDLNSAQYFSASATRFHL